MKFQKMMTRRILLAAVIVLQIVCALYFGGKKAGFHEDEYYSYYSSNRTAGFYYDDRVWTDTDSWLKEFYVVRGEGFNFPLVHLVQSWDVHPPLYYDVLHFVCSVTPEIFSKWQGISVNIAFFVLGQLVLFALARRKECGGSDAAALCAVALWGFSPAAMSMIMFIRMYAMLTFFVLLCALVHLGASDAFMKAERIPLRSLLPQAVLMAAVTLGGFLTHYYYAVFLFFTGLIFLLELVLKKRIKEAALYCGAQAGALLLSVLIYPSAAVHILRGYRGREAQEAFFDLANLKERFSLFVPVVNEYVFGGLFAAAAAAVILAVILDIRKRSVTLCSLMPLLASVFYFMVTAKTSLLLGASSLRYVMPVCPLFVMVVVSAIFGLAGRAAGCLGRPSAWYAAAGALLGILLACNAYGLGRDKVLFLYQEEKAYTAEAAAAASENIPAAVIYNPASPYNMFRIANVLLKYPEVYLIDPDNTEEVTDGRIQESLRVMVYQADDTGGGANACRLLGKESAERLWNRDMYTACLAGPGER
ncbi:MAG: hypothetical protein IJ930_06800 [Lachnospiraceae bacterium]|nr:hypothetical protein [Lachnospiraceae bacterium]